MLVIIHDFPNMSAMLPNLELNFVGFSFIFGLVFVNHFLTGIYFAIKLVNIQLVLLCSILGVGLLHVNLVLVIF